MTTKTKSKKSPIDLGISGGFVSVNSESAQALVLIERASIDPRCNIDKMRALLDMRTEIVTDDRNISLAEAMFAAQAEMVPVVRADPGEKKKYAKLERIDAAIRPIYTKHGFSLSFNSSALENGGVKILCKLRHKLGGIEQYELSSTELDMAGPKGGANKTSIQGLGSTISYLRRYLTCLIFNVALKDEDDDGANSPDKKKSDAMRDAVNEETKAKAPVTDAKFEEIPPREKWDGMIHDGDADGRPMQFTGSPQAVMKSSAVHLLKALGNQKTKDARLELLGENSAFVALLKKQGKTEIVASFISLANQGE